MNAQCLEHLLFLFNKLDEAQMEAIVAEPTKEGHVPKTHAEAVAEVLPPSKFLKNVDLESAAPKWSAKSTVSACAQELETEVESEKQEALKLMFGESEQARKKQLREIKEFKNQEEETNTLLRCLLCLDKE
ncbi:hypothetical protein GQ55_5G358200 [Panicum hallii var. hallii]|uniref:Uncharacterized protein n=1 Tax=Panicum hallii var. hallii TaxID=1504633 RepID=A0A2T7DMD0_9POAL|nr:hypothetical protein GQ55_5G358200 [Panicum hallii var. hallii]